jgi:hypothetical protein
MDCGSGFPAAIRFSTGSTDRGWKAAPTIKPIDTKVDADGSWRDLTLLTDRIHSFDVRCSLVTFLIKLAAPAASGGAEP